MHSHLHQPESWSFPLGLTASLLAVAIVYVRGWWRCRTTFPKVISVSRLVAFLSGLLFVWIAVASPLGTLDHEMLTAHMLQHLLLMAAAAPLILLGAPAVPLLHCLPQSFIRTGVSSLFRRPWVQWLGRAVTHPMFCLFAPSLALIAWHVPVLFEIGMRSQAWHDVQQMSFFATGILLWWPVIQPWPSVARWPRWSIPLYLFFATLPCDALSAFLTFCDRAIYPSYQTVTAPFGLSPLADQQLAGSLMWVCVTFIYLFPAVGITMRILSPSRRQRSFSEAPSAKTPPKDPSGIGVSW
ncbi:MAG TPA: cytochrome c oxidase assembly protein [Terriglobales bacterium]|jgi:putative membrane protein|nr:cytochrome c oxidase assembly protein [Terriglobales bacterium]